MQATGVRNEREPRALVVPMSLSMGMLGVVVGLPVVGLIVAVLFGVGLELGSMVGHPPARPALFGLASLHALFLIVLGA